MAKDNRLDSILLRVVAGSLALLTTSFVSWATWATVAIFMLQRDQAVTKAANRLVDNAPNHTPYHPESQLAYPGLGLPRNWTPRLPGR